ncbi:MAG: hypothetical protein GX938_04905, partial [Spirochaetales bacterium]|nr:hypothetical protein [Spirochaetales bacterium]
LRSQTLSREIAAVFDDETVASESLLHIDELLLSCRIIEREEAKGLRTLTNYLYHLLMQVYG